MPENDCKSIIEKILVEATENGQTITEDELIKKLDSIEGFWEKAVFEDFKINVKPQNQSTTN